MIKVGLRCVIAIFMVGVLSAYEMKLPFKSSQVKLEGKCLNMPDALGIREYKMKDQMVYLSAFTNAQEWGIDVSKECKNIFIANKYRAYSGDTPAGFLTFEIQVNQERAYEVTL